MTHVLDTDHLTLLQQQDGQEWATIVAHINACGQENVAASVVSFHEQLLGCHARLNQARRLPARGTSLWSRETRGISPKCPD